MELHMGRKVAALIAVTLVVLIAAAIGRASATQHVTSCPAGYVTDRVEGCQEAGIWRTTAVNGTVYDRSAHAVYQAFLPFGAWVARTMVCIMGRESHGNPYAANYHDSNGGSYGLLQLNGVHRWRSETLEQFKARMFNVRTHLQAAVRLYKSSGLRPWRGGC